jgi:hypothetical protein
MIRWHATQKHTPPWKVVEAMDVIQIMAAFVGIRVRGYRIERAVIVTEQAT